MCGLSSMQTRGLCMNQETETRRRSTGCFAEKPKKQLSPGRHPRRPLFARQTAELHFKAENLGASCEHVSVNVISQHTQLIDSAGIQRHADGSVLVLLFLNREKICPWKTSRQSIIGLCVRRWGPSLKPRHWIIKGRTTRNKGRAGPSGLHQNTCWLREKALHTLTLTYTKTLSYPDLYSSPYYRNFLTCTSCLNSLITMLIRGRPGKGTTTIYE